jgi:hypothetical protein
MFSWFISLLVLLSYNGKTVPPTSGGLNGGGNPHVIPADNPQPGPGDPADPDGGGHG